MLIQYKIFCYFLALSGLKKYLCNPNWKIIRTNFKENKKNFNKVNTLSYKTKTVTPTETERKWYLVDAENQTLGRISSEIAKILQGKNKASYTPNIDNGDHVVIINAEKVALTGKN